MTTKDEALKMAKQWFFENSHKLNGDLAWKVMQKIEEALAQPAQEPVAWMKSALDNARDVCKYLDHDMIKEAKAHTKFFWSDIEKIKEPDTHAAPEQNKFAKTKSWQGLSDDEDDAIIQSIWSWGNDFPYDEYRVCIEQALKEKNHG